MIPNRLERAKKKKKAVGSFFVYYAKQKTKKKLNKWKGPQSKKKRLERKKPLPVSGNMELSKIVGHDSILCLHAWSPIEKKQMD